MRGLKTKLGRSNYSQRRKGGRKFGPRKTRLEIGNKLAWFKIIRVEETILELWQG